MPKLILIFFFFVNLGFSQVYNRLTQLNLGFSHEEFTYKQNISAFNDSSTHHFEFVSHSPLVSINHNIIIGDIFAVSGKIGYQYMNIFYDHKRYGASFAYFTLSPILTVFYRKGFEYYVKLNVGANFWFNNPSLLNDQARRTFPEKAMVITGFTPIGLNYFLTKKIGFNLELSIWTPELLTFGLNYRFHRGDKPSIQKMQAI
ncbi:hypothetical protein [Crocinitomix algicola]|uniref:hypothetical protein n=1 Tax=Crocinitomix algicola TaxID=1740263 RepID=UPI000871BC08|nr:hypothetical protein [Crocinitomix algicola]